MQEKRKFGIIVNSKEYGTCSDLSPISVAKKVVNPYSVKYILIFS
jgi:hypothetical protein